MSSGIIRKNNKLDLELSVLIPVFNEDKILEKNIMSLYNHLRINYSLFEIVSNNYYKNLLHYSKSIMFEENFYFGIS